MTTDSPPGTSAEHAAEMLKEKSLWAIYRSGRGIPRSKTNIYVALVFCLGAVVLAMPDSRPAALATQLHAIATIALSSTVSLLGFLIAGFSFFATVSDKAMFCRMHEQKHDASGLSYLKYNLFIFMRVFAEYLVMSILSLGIVLIFQPDSAPRNSLSSLVRDLDWPRCVRICVPIQSAVLSIGLGVFTGLFVYILMELGSFIFNVYHVVMTSIIWELFKEEEKKREKEEKEKPIG